MFASTGPCRAAGCWKRISRPNLKERTNGQLELIVSSFPQLGLSGTGTLGLIADGALDSAAVFGGYVVADIPAFDIQNLWGIYVSREQEFAGTQAVIRDIEDMVLAETGGVILNRNWNAGNDQYLFCHETIQSPADFTGRKTRSHSAPLSEWLRGMGAEAQVFAFVEVYTAIERQVRNAQ